MLVLSRRVGQRVVLAGNIHVVVLNVHGDRVKLGFEGPAEVPIHRGEVYQRLVDEDTASECTADLNVKRVAVGPQALVKRTESLASH